MEVTGISRKEFDSILKGRPFTEDEAAKLAEDIIGQKIPPFQIAAILTAMRTRQLHPDELLGFRTAIMDKANRFRCKKPVLDLCGTGGDGKSTFNISTTTAFLCAALGVSIAKHGNYSFSSQCGSSNVLESLGIRFARTPQEADHDLEYFNLTFLHAPNWHSCLKDVAHIRKELGFATIFNLLGPLLNPAEPEMRLVGVYSPAIQSLYRDVLLRLPGNFITIHSLDGYDELALTGVARIISRSSEDYLTPDEFGVEIVKTEALIGSSDIAGNARLVERILRGAGNQAQNDIVAANATLALLLSGRELSLKEAFKLAIDCLLSGEAGRLLDKMRSSE